MTKEYKMISSEPIYTSVLPNPNDPQYQYEPEPAARPTHSDRSGWQSSSRRKPRHHIYEQYFTPEERKMLAAIPENDVTSEINLLRVLLARSFALVPSGPTDKKPPLSLKFQYDLVTTFSRVALVLAGLVALHLKQHPPRNYWFDCVMEMIRQVNIEQGVVD